MTLTEQIQFCISRRTEWEAAQATNGEVGLAAKKNVAMYQAIETSLLQTQKLMEGVEVQYKIIHGEPEVKGDVKGKTVEERIKDKKK